jgi:hypothetical protein
MHKSATKCNKTVGKWCKNKHGASKIIDTLETYQCPLALHHFPRRRPGTTPAASPPPPPSSKSVAPSGKVLSGASQGHSLKWEEGKKASPPWGDRSVLKKNHIPCRGRKGLREKAPPLSRGKKRTREGSIPLLKVKNARHVVNESCGEISCLPLPPRERALRTSGRSPLPQTCRGHH